MSSRRRRRIEPEPEEQLVRQEVAAVKRVAYISPEKILLLMDSEQPLRLRLAIAKVNTAGAHSRPEQEDRDHERVPSGKQV